LTAKEKLLHLSGKRRKKDHGIILEGAAGLEDSYKQSTTRNDILLFFDEYFV